MKTNLLVLCAILLFISLKSNGQEVSTSEYLGENVLQKIQQVNDQKATELLEYSFTINAPLNEMELEKEDSASMLFVDRTIVTKKVRLDPEVLVKVL